MRINEHIQGLTIQNALTDGEQLILVCTNGQEFRIKWIDGEPHLVGIDVKVQVTLPGLLGDVNI